MIVCNNQLQSSQMIYRQIPPLEGHLVHQKGASEAQWEKERPFRKWYRLERYLHFKMRQILPNYLPESLHKFIPSSNWMKSAVQSIHIIFPSCLQRMDILFIEHKVFYVFNAVGSLFKYLLNASNTLATLQALGVWLKVECLLS